MIKETQPKQDPISFLLEKGYTEFKIFHRKDCLDYNCGYGIFTGEFGNNCDGITLKFTDGREFLAEFCTLQDTDNPQLMWGITKEIERYTNQLINNLCKIKQEYNNLI